MTLQGAIQQLHDMRSDDNFPIYYKPAIDKVIETILMDAQEVRRGRWVKGDEMADYPRVPYKSWETYCSCCGAIKEQSNDGFCGNCGARMEATE